MRTLEIGLTCLAAISMLNGQAQELSPALFHGTGRACYGSLSIQPQTITWNTPFSRCKATSYSLTEQSDDAGHARYTYLLRKTNKACRYQVLSLTHADGKSAGIGWEVNAYVNEAGYNADKASGYTASLPDMMSCYLVRAVTKNSQSSARPNPSVISGPAI